MFWNLITKFLTPSVVQIMGAEISYNMSTNWHIEYLHQEMKKLNNKIFLIQRDLDAANAMIRILENPGDYKIGPSILAERPR